MGSGISAPVDGEFNTSGFLSDDADDPFAFQLPTPKISGMDHGAHGGHDMHASHDMHAGHDMGSMVNEAVKSIVNGTVAAMAGGHNHGAHGAMGHHGAMSHDRESVTTHDHSDMATHEHSGGGMHHGGMMMYFHFGYEEETVLFQGWTLNSVEALVGTCIGVFFLAVFYEGLKYFREYLLRRSAANVQYSSVSVPTISNGAGINGDSSKSRSRARSISVQMLSSSHFIQTVLHLMQITLSYFLMLIVMTYNAWLMIAICAGAAVGYFLFGWSKAHVVDITEHCH